MPCDMLCEPPVLHPPAPLCCSYVDEGAMKTQYAVIIGGQNFGCGSSREHAPVAIGAAGGQVVVAESYARIFFRNCMSTGELYPVETDLRLCDELKTGARHRQRSSRAAPHQHQQCNWPHAYSGCLGPVAHHVLPVVAAGEEVTVDMEANVLTNHSTGKTYELKALGDVSDLGAPVTCCCSALLHPCLPMAASLLAASYLLPACLLSTSGTTHWSCCTLPITTPPPSHPCAGRARH